MSNTPKVYVYENFGLNPFDLLGKLKRGTEKALYTVGGKAANMASNAVGGFEKVLDNLLPEAKKYGTDDDPRLKKARSSPEFLKTSEQLKKREANELERASNHKKKKFDKNEKKKNISSKIKSIIMKTKLGHDIAAGATLGALTEILNNVRKKRKAGNQALIEEMRMPLNKIKMALNPDEIKNIRKQASSHIGYLDNVGRGAMIGGGVFGGARLLSPWLFEQYYRKLTKENKQIEKEQKEKAAAVNRRYATLNNLLRQKYVNLKPKV